MRMIPRTPTSPSRAVVRGLFGNLRLYTPLAYKASEVQLWAAAVDREGDTSRSTSPQIRTCCLFASTQIRVLPSISAVFSSVVATYGICAVRRGDDYTVTNGMCCVVCKKRYEYVFVVDCFGACSRKTFGGKQIAEQRWRYKRNNENKVCSDNSKNGNCVVKLLTCSESWLLRLLKRKVRGLGEFAHDNISGSMWEAD